MKPSWRYAPLTLRFGDQVITGLGWSDGRAAWVNGHGSPALAGSIEGLVAGICEFLRALSHAAKQSARVFEVLFSPAFPFVRARIHAEQSSMEVGAACAKNFSNRCKKS